MDNNKYGIRALAVENTFQMCDSLALFVVIIILHHHHHHQHYHLPLSIGARKHVSKTEKDIRDVKSERWKFDMWRE